MPKVRPTYTGRYPIWVSETKPFVPSMSLQVLGEAERQRRNQEHARQAALLHEWKALKTASEAIEKEVSKNPFSKVVLGNPKLNYSFSTRVIK